MKSLPADEQRFVELVEENRNKILKVCRVYAWNAFDHDDLYQEILFQIWRGLPSLKEKQFVNTWLYRVSINTAISFVRKRSTRSQRLVLAEHSELARTIESRQPAEPPADDRLIKLYSAISRLDPIEKALVTLFLEDFSYEQMAEVTGIKANHVGVILHRSRKKLFALMEESQ